MRSEDLDGSIRVRLLFARSRIAPAGKKGTNLKKRTSVELELCGAALLAEMAVKVLQALEIEFDSVSLWTDSAINLARICSDDNRWNLFVANRVSKIQNLTPVASWKWCRKSSRCTFQRVFTRSVAVKSFMVEWPHLVGRTIRSVAEPAIHADKQ